MKSIQRWHVDMVISCWQGISTGHDMLWLIHGLNIHRAREGCCYRVTERSTNHRVGIASQLRHRDGTGSSQSLQENADGGEVPKAQPRRLARKRRGRRRRRYKWRCNAVHVRMKAYMLRHHSRHR